MKLLFVILAFLPPSLFGQTVNDLRPTVTMKEYVDMQAAYIAKISEIQNQNIKDNVNKESASMDKRLEGMNEFRDTLRDQAGTFITREELFAWVIAIIGVGFGVMNLRNKGKNVTENVAAKNVIEAPK